jgi:hypothetical protein
MKNLTLRRATLLLALTLPGFCWGPSLNALIVNDGTTGLEVDVTSNLSAKLVTAGYAVTVNTGVPGGSLAGYQQIWDVRYNNTTPLTGSDITAYVTYLAGGGSLFVMGENTGFITRDTSVIALVSAAGGGSITVVNTGGTQTVEPPFSGPTPLSSITYLASGGSSTRANGRFVTIDSSNTIGSALVFAPGTMANALGGTLMTVFDVNFLQAGADANSQTFTSNLIAYLAAPTTVGPPPTPAPPSILLILTGAGAIMLYSARRRWMERGLKDRSLRSRL